MAIIAFWMLIILYLRLIRYMLETRKLILDTKITQQSLRDKSVNYFMYLNRLFSSTIFSRYSSNVERTVNNAICCQAWLDSLRNRKA